MTPPDMYNGGDKGHLKSMIEKAWEKEFPGEKILGVRFHMPNGERKHGVEWNKGYSRWEEYDKSVLPVKVVVKSGSKTATIYRAYINKNNMSGTIDAGVQTRQAA